MVGQVRTSNLRTPRITSGESSRIKYLIKKGPSALGSVLRLNLVQHEQSCMNLNSFSLLYNRLQVTSQVMRMLGGSIEREVTGYDPEWAGAIASLTVSEKIRITPSRKRKGLQDGNSANGNIDSSKRLMRTSYKEKRQEIGAQKKIITFEEPENDWTEVESENAEHKNSSGESDMLKKMVM